MDSQKFEIFFKKNYDKAIGIARKYLKDKDEAKDCVMTVFSKFYQKMHNDEAFFYKVRDFDSYFFKSLKNDAFSMKESIKQDISHKIEEDDYPLYVYEDFLEENTLKLEKNEKEIILHLLLGDTILESSKKMGINKNDVKRIREKTKSKIGAWLLSKDIQLALDYFFGFLDKRLRQTFYYMFIAKKKQKSPFLFCKACLLVRDNMQRSKFSFMQNFILTIPESKIQKRVVGKLLKGQTFVEVAHSEQISYAVVKSIAFRTILTVAKKYKLAAA